MTALTVVDRHLILRRLAVGLLERWENQQHPAGASGLPYPPHLQRALDELSLESFLAGTDAPSSVVDLMQWSERPLRTWPTSLVAPDSDEAYESLLSFGAPTDACDELGALRGDIAADARESATIETVRSACRRAKSPEAYIAFREFLIRNPVVDVETLDRLKLDPKLLLIAGEIEDAYEPPRPEWVHEGKVLVCRTCGNALRIVPGERHRVCVEPLCSHKAAGGKWFEPEHARVLRRDLRKFVAGPGRAEIRIADRIRKWKVPCLLWPDFDAYDLRIFTTRAWAVDVKAWRNPSRLAYRLKQKPPIQPEDADRVIVVVADEIASPGYMSALNGWRAEVGWTPAEILSEKELLSQVKTELEVRTLL